MKDFPLKDALLERRILLCLGPGGVGKTTVSASLALSAALSNRRALVCTIDPAKRLANALGLAELGNTEAKIPKAQLAEADLPSDLPLFAMMLDMKQTWDEFIRRNAAPDQVDKVLNNRFYRSLSSVLAGSQEYIAMEKLWQLRRERDYPLIVLDTPPTQHALDFLEAPTRVLDFLGSDAARFLLAPALAAGKLGLSLFKKGGLVARNLARFTGAAMLEELANFLLVLSGLQENIRERAAQVKELLTDSGTAFVLVSDPAPERLNETLELHAHLKKGGYPVAAVVVNRVHPAPDPRIQPELSEIAPDLRRKVETTLAEAQALADRDRKAVQKLSRELAPTPIVEIPQMNADVHELRGLEQTARYLAGKQRR